MERQIGKPFKIYGVFYIAVEDKADGARCDRCAVSNFCGISGEKDVTFGPCLGYRRKDRKNVHFEHFGVNF